MALLQLSLLRAGGGQDGVQRLFQDCGTGAQRVLSRDVCEVQPHWCTKGTRVRAAGEVPPPPPCPEPFREGQCSQLVLSQLQTDTGGNALPFAQPSHGQSPQMHVGSSPRSVHVFYNKQSWHKTNQTKMKPKQNNLGDWDEKPGTLPASWMPWVLLQTFSSQSILLLGS